MHRASLRLAVLLILLAVMAAAGGCVAIYTVSRAMEQPDESEGGPGLPPVLSDTTAQVPSTTTAVVTTSTPGGDGLPFNPHVTDTPPVPVPSGTETPDGTVRSWSEAASPTPVTTETPPDEGTPLPDDLPRP